MASNLSRLKSIRITQEEIPRDWCLCGLSQDKCEVKEHKDADLQHLINSSQIAWTVSRIRQYHIQPAYIAWWISDKNMFLSLISTKPE